MSAQEKDMENYSALEDFKRRRCVRRDENFKTKREGPLSWGKKSGINDRAKEVGISLG